MSDITTQVTGLINEELSRVTRADLAAVRSIEKTAAVPGRYILGAVGLLGGGFMAGKSMADASLKSELEDLNKQQLQRNLMSAGLGAAAAIKLRKPVQGLLVPDPEDLTSLEDDEFDDLWKQRSRSRYV